MLKIICYTLLAFIISANTVWARDLSDLEEVSIKVIGLDKQGPQDAEIIQMPDPNFEEFKKITQPGLSTIDLQDGSEIITTVPTPKD